MTRELEIPELEGWVRVYVISPRRYQSGRLESWVCVGPITCDTKLTGFTVQVGRYVLGFSQWMWWK